MKSWLKSEIEWCALDKKPDGHDADAEVYRARSLEKDFRRAEALTIRDKISVDLVQLAKVLISRGDLGKAWAALDEAGKNITEDNLDFWEIAFERSRVLFAMGQWEKSKILTSKIIASCPTGITVMGAYQTQSLANTELGNFRMALSDVEKVISLGALYPKAFSLFYAQVQKVRLLYLDSDLVTSERLRIRLWNQCLKSDKIDLDDLLTLTRLELFSKSKIPIHRLLNLLRVQWTCADLMGDNLYRSLTEAYGFILGLTSSLSQEARQFERVKSLLEGPTTEAKHLEILLENSNISSESACVENLEPVRLVYLPLQSMLVDIQENVVRKFQWKKFSRGSRE